MDYEIKEHKEFQYIDEGDGPPIVLLHGLFGALSNFKDVITHFEKDYRVIIPLMPIYTLPIISTNLDNLAKFVAKFIDYKGFDKVNLLGNSLGGHVALIYSTRFPEKLNTLTLTGSSGLYENAFGGSFPRREDRNYLKEKIQITFYDPKHASEELVDEVFELVNDKGKLIRSIALAKSAIRNNMKKDLPTIQVPTCLIWGRNDNITPPEVAEEFNQLMPQAELFWIDKCGHAPMMEHPEEFNRILEPWINKFKD